MQRRLIASYLLVAGACSAPSDPRASSEEGFIPLGRGWVDARGASLVAGTTTVTVGLAAYGRAGAMRDAAMAPVRAVGIERHVERGPGVTEWWREVDAGLEQGVTLARRPDGDGPLALEMSVGDAIAEDLPDGSISLLDRGSRAALATYRELYVTDASGARIPATMHAALDAIRIEVDDADAAYPLVVDPILQVEEATLIPASGGGASDGFGASVAMAGDGTRTIVGGPGAGVRGEARVFLRAGTVWNEEATLTRTSSGSIVSSFAGALSVTTDATRVLVGDTGYSAPSSAGGAHVFLRTGAVWSREASLRAAAPTFENYADAIAISGDGTRLIIGASQRDGTATDTGAAEVWLRTGTTWAREAVLTAAGGAASDQFGVAVSLSSNGSLAAVGAGSDDTVAGAGAGTVRIFTRTGTTWAETALLTHSGPAAMDFFGYPLALSPDGTHLLAGVINDNSEAGTVRVFVRAGLAWSETATISAPSAAANDNFGISIAVNTDASYCLIGADGDDTAAGTNAGSAHLFRRSGSAWIIERSLTASAGAANDGFGRSVALANDASRAAVGTIGDDTTWGTDGGSARVYGPKANGATCGSATECISGFCADGVCCSTSCGGGSTTDCQACSAGLTGGANGTCAAALSGTTCRASSAPCNGAEVCNGTGTGCPADIFSPTGAVCRPPAGPCDIAEVCNGATSGCPGDTFASSGTVCGMSPGDCATAGTCTGSSAACGSPGVRLVGTMCRASTGPCDRDDTCDGVTALCLDQYLPMGVSCGGAPSGGCDAQDTCAGSTAECVPVVAPAGTTCRSATGACDIAETCNGASAACPAIDDFQPAGALCRAGVGPCDVSEFCDGFAGGCPVDRFLPSDVTCRAASGDCDLAESCDGASAGCPGNVLAPPRALCRPVADLCDLGEECTGLSATCPTDAFAGPSVVCRPLVAGGCDLEDRCNGAMANCPSDTVQPSGNVCRATTGACDVTEACDGTSPACPADALVPNGVACGMGGGSCSTPGTCNGTGAACPGASPLAAGTVCQVADPTSACDVDDVCDGATDACVPRFRAAGVMCGAAPSDVCDAPDECTGTSGDCQPTFLVAVECRASAGTCDLPETCLGDSPSCPPEVFASAGTVCLNSTESCDPAEVCDGVGAMCPADVSSCPDAGTSLDAGPLFDGGGRDGDGGEVTSDAGTLTATAGCACRAAGGSNVPWSLLAVGIALASIVSRRRRAARA